MCLRWGPQSTQPTTWHECTTCHYPPTTTTIKLPTSVTRCYPHLPPSDIRATQNIVFSGRCQLVKWMGVRFFSVNNVCVGAGLGLVAQVQWLGIEENKGAYIAPYTNPTVTLTTKGTPQCACRPELRGLQRSEDPAHPRAEATRRPRDWGFLSPEFQSVHGGKHHNPGIPVCPERTPKETWRSGGLDHGGPTYLMRLSEDCNGSSFLCE